MHSVGALTALLDCCLHGQAEEVQHKNAFRAGEVQRGGVVTAWTCNRGKGWGGECLLLNSAGHWQRTQQVMS